MIEAQTERYTKLAKQGAAWWRQQLEQPEFDNGDRSHTGVMGRGLAAMLAKQDAATAEQLDVFEQELSKIILGWLLEDPCPKELSTTRPYYCDTEEEWQQILASPRRKQCLGTDYGPDGYFIPALEASGVSPNIFPWKTLMWVNWDDRPECCYIEVRAGRQTQRLPPL